MTVVDTRGRRTPPRRAPTAAGAKPTEGALPGPQGTRLVAAGRPTRPGAAVALLLALVVTLAGVAVGAVLGSPLGIAAFVAWVVAAPLAAGAVRRGRSLWRLVLSVPLAFLLAICVAAAIEVAQGGSALTLRQTALTAVQVAVFQAPWLWGGTTLAVLVALRRRTARG